MTDSPTCHVHGRAGLAHVCRHIRTAIERATAVPEWLTFPLPRTLYDYAVVRVCPTCAEQFSLPVPARMLTELEVERLKTFTTPTCEACFAAGTSSP
ncbi:MAG TPA: hypothetical protein VGM39_16425 [Kofleriaceae bacterium]